MNPQSVPGYGDSSTWAPCTGHPNDPRTPDNDDVGGKAADLEWQMDKAQECIDKARGLLNLGDEASVLAAESLMVEAAGWLDNE